MKRRIATGAGIVGVLVLGAWLAQSGSERGQTRTYYIAADEVEWDYAPSGDNRVSGRPFNEDEKLFAEPGPHLVGRVLKKAIYREYTDSTFTTLKPRPAE